MKYASIFVLAALSLASCRSRQPQTPLETAPEAIKMPMYDVPHAALKSALRAASGDERSVGTLKVDFNGKSLSAKLDLRIRTQPEPLLWMDVADPLIGLKIGRARVYQDSVQGFIRLYRQYVNEPLSRLRSMGIDLQTEDARRLALGLPVLVPTTWSEAQWTPQDSLLIMSVREQRGAYEVLVEVAVAPSNPDVVYVGGGEFAIRGNVSHGDGMWKTTDGGVNWRPTFDAQPVQSIGALAVARSDRNVVWAGTGERSLSGHI